MTLEWNGNAEEKNLEKYKVLSFIVYSYLPRQGRSTDILLSPTFPHVLFSLATPQGHMRMSAFVDVSKSKSLCV